MKNKKNPPILDDGKSKQNPMYGEIRELITILITSASDM